MKTQIEKLKELYELTHNTKKHCSYQLLPEGLIKYFDRKSIEEKAHYERERLEFILKHCEVENKDILDIGGNCGYFSFELINRGAIKVDCYEGGDKHAEFLKVASNILNTNDKINIINEYYSFQKDVSIKYDTILLLNILHHIGDDYGDKSLNIKAAKDKILEQINVLSYNTSNLIFQMGFNWKGNIKNCLFQNGTKSEMIEFIKSGVKDYWNIESIGIPEIHNGKIVYTKVNEFNIIRDDSLGEFLNRPIFILRRK